VLDIIKVQQNRAAWRAGPEHGQRGLKTVDYEQIWRRIKVCCHLLCDFGTAISSEGRLILGSENSAYVVVPRRFMADAARQECHIDRNAPKDRLPLLKHGPIISQPHHLSGHQVHDGDVVEQPGDNMENHFDPAMRATAVLRHYRWQHGGND
jgi:hypothetical protein